MSPGVEEFALNVRQSIAARHSATCLHIVAAPGTGKTRVTAHRFGLLRFDRRDTRAVLAISFTRAAVAELRERIEQRWGGCALDWPHLVTMNRPGFGPDSMFGVPTAGLRS